MFVYKQKYTFGSYLYLYNLVFHNSLIHNKQNYEKLEYIW